MIMTVLLQVDLDPVHLAAEFIVPRIVVRRNRRTSSPPHVTGLISREHHWHRYIHATFADRQTESIDNQIALGLFYTGVFDSRSHDDIGIGLGRTHVNSRVTNAEELQNAVGTGPVGIQTSEYVGEIYYGLQATSWLILRPNVQYIHQPGGVGHTTDDIILGLKLLLRF